MKRIDNHAIAHGPMKTALMGLEVDEILAIMWAIETATEEWKGDSEWEDLAEEAWSVHQRMQEAWKEMRDK